MGKMVDFIKGAEIRYRPDVRCWGVVIEAVEAPLPATKGDLYCMSRTWFSRGTRSTTARVAELPPALAEIIDKQDAANESADTLAKTHYKSELLDVVAHDETPGSGAHASPKKDEHSSGEGAVGEATAPSKTARKSPEPSRRFKKFDKKSTLFYFILVHLYYFYFNKLGN